MPIEYGVLKVDCAVRKGFLFSHALEKADKGPFQGTPYILEYKTISNDSERHIIEQTSPGSVHGTRYIRVKQHTGKYTDDIFYYYKF